MTFAREMLRQACDELNKKELPLQARLRAIAELFVMLDSRDFPGDYFANEFTEINKLLAGLLRGSGSRNSFDPTMAEQLVRRVLNLSVQLEKRADQKAEI
jgi:response regulator RpfG family c-di-GMP phosphodiesterase